MAIPLKENAIVHPAAVSLSVARTRTRPLIALVSRTIFFAFWQGIIAGLLALSGRVAPWEASAAWWPLTAALTNLVSITLLWHWFRQEGMRYWDLFRIERSRWKQDLLLVIGLFVLSAPLVLLPNFALATWLFGNAAVTAELFLRPLPLWAVWATALLFPATIVLAELPTYFGYALPRLGKGWGVVLLVAFFLSIQHATLPLLFDWRFILWRAGMFLPFALLMAMVLRWRPRLLPYLVIGHSLLDLQVVLMLLPLAY